MDPHATVDSNDNSNRSGDVPVAINVHAAAIDVSASVANMSAAVASVSAAAIDVSAAAIDLRPSNADMCAAVNVAVSVRADVNVADINIVLIALNHAASPYNNIMPAARRESTGGSVKPLNVTGINNQHKMWMQQVMMDDWGIQFSHEFQIRVIHHVTFHRNQIVYIVAKTGSGSGKLAISLTIESLQTRVTLLMVPFVGLGSDQVNNIRNSKNLIEAYHLNENRGRNGYALWTMESVAFTPPA